jgi:uncharacterized membrane protein YbhN (UPF0104 family)
VKKTVKLILKIAVSGVAVYFVLSKLDYKDIAAAVKKADFILLLFALAVYAFSQIIAASRLNCLFDRINLKITFKENVKLYWLGLFYNLFLPGGVGGDGFKIYLLDKYLKIGVKKPLGTILVDRVSGLSIIVVFLLFFACFIGYSFPLQKWTWSAIPIVFLCFYLFVRIINSALNSVSITVLCHAFFVQALQMGAALVILAALNTDLSSGYAVNYLFLFLLSAIMGALPVTLGGIGAREVTFIFGAEYLGIEPTSAVALSLLFYAASTVTALPGLIYTIRPSRILKDNPAVEDY